MKTVTLKILHDVGLHARPAAKFVKMTKVFESDISIRNITRDGEFVNAKSLVKVLKIAAAKDHQVLIEVTGADEDLALNKIIEFIELVPEDSK